MWCPGQQVSCFQAGPGVLQASPECGGPARNGSYLLDEPALGCPAPSSSSNHAASFLEGNLPGGRESVAGGVHGGLQQVFAATWSKMGRLPTKGVGVPLVACAGNGDMEGDGSEVTWAIRAPQPLHSSAGPLRTRCLCSACHAPGTEPWPRGRSLRSD